MELEEKQQKPEQKEQQWGSRTQAEVGHPPRVKDRRMQDRLLLKAQFPSRAKEAGEPARGSCSSNCLGPKNEAGGQAENVPQTKTRMKKFDQAPSESRAETKDIAATSHELRVQSRAVLEVSGGIANFQTSRSPEFGK